LWLQAKPGYLQLLFLEKHFGGVSNRLFPELTLLEAIANCKPITPKAKVIVQE